jgi:uncharacterized protein YkwD
VTDARPHVCVDRDLPDDAQSPAAALAVALRPDNLGPALWQPASLGVGAGPGVAGMVALAPYLTGTAIPAHLVGLVGKYWPPGKTIRVAFLDGSPRLHGRVAKSIEEGPLGTGGWPEVGNIRFDWSGGPSAEIRVSFYHDAGSWSMIGTDCLQVAPSEPTLNLGWIRDDTPDDQLHVALHEFGHALGFGHEHQSPVEGIPWEWPKVYAWYSATQGWSRAMVDRQVRQRYLDSQTNHGAWDRASIMEYPVDASLTLDGSSIPWNTRLSDEDRRFAATIYPSSVIPAPPVPPVPPPPSPPVPVSPPDTGDHPELFEVWELLQHHNERRHQANLIRRALGLVPLPDLEIDGRLYANVAQPLAAELARRGVLTHARLDGTKFSAIIARALGHPYACAENAATGPDSWTVVDEFMRSRPHKANVLGPWNTFAGAVATAPDGTRYWVCDYASIPRP